MAVHTSNGCSMNMDGWNTRRRVPGFWLYKKPLYLAKHVAGIMCPIFCVQLFVSIGMSNDTKLDLQQVISFTPKNRSIVMLFLLSTWRKCQLCTDNHVVHCFRLGRAPRAAGLPGYAQQLTNPSLREREGLVEHCAGKRPQMSHMVQTLEGVEGGLGSSMQCCSGLAGSESAGATNTAIGPARTCSNNASAHHCMSR